MACGLRQARPGYSLVEISVVVMILGIVTSIATPMYFHALARGRVDAAARRIVADLELVQGAAECSSSSRTLQFSCASNAYSVAGIADWDRPAVDYSVNLAAHPYACNLVCVDCGGDEQLVYNGFGLPDSAGTITVASGNLQRIVTIDVQTGKGTIQ